MSDLIIIHPGTASAAYGPLESVAAVEPPMWARLIAGYCRDRKHSVRIIDAEATRKAPHLVAIDVWAHKARLICLCAYGHHPSASTQSMDAVYEIARQVRSVSSAKIVVVGGHVSALPSQTLLECKFIDYVVVGEGPREIEALLMGLIPAQIPGVAWRRSDGSVECNSRMPLIDDLSLLSGDAWDLLPMERYRAHNWQCLSDPQARHPYASIYTSLGCPYACEFCCINAPFGERRYRMRPPALVAAEVRHLHEQYRVRTFKITDEMFVLRPSHYLDICTRLAAMNLEFNIWAYARVDTVKPAHLQLMRKAGIQWLALGIESADPRVRDNAEKYLRCDDMQTLIKQIQDAGINVIANYIFGLPSDTWDSMQATYEMALTLDSDWANFYCAAAYPGSPLYDRALVEQRNMPKRWSNYAQHSYDFEPMDTVRGPVGREVLSCRDMAHVGYFKRDKFLERTAQKFGPAAAKHVLETQTNPLPRRALEAA